MKKNKYIIYKTKFALATKHALNNVYTITALFHEAIYLRQFGNFLLTNISALWFSAQTHAILTAVLLKPAFSILKTIAKNWIFIQCKSVSSWLVSKSLVLKQNVLFFWGGRGRVWTSPANTPTQASYTAYYMKGLLFVITNHLFT